MIRGTGSTWRSVCSIAVTLFRVMWMLLLPSSRSRELFSLLIGVPPVSKLESIIRFEIEIFAIKYLSINSIRVRACCNIPFHMEYQFWIGKFPIKIKCIALRFTLVIKNNLGLAKLPLKMHAFTACVNRESQLSSKWVHIWLNRFSWAYFD